MDTIGTNKYCPDRGCPLVRVCDTLCELYLGFSKCPYRIVQRSNAEGRTQDGHQFEIINKIYATAIAQNEEFQNTVHGVI